MTEQEIQTEKNYRRDERIALCNPSTPDQLAAATAQGVLEAEEWERAFRNMLDTTPSLREDTARKVV